MDAENPTSLRQLLLRAAATLLAVVVLYALSVGPAYYLALKLGRNPIALDRFYVPLSWATKGTPLEKPIDAYVDLWLRLAGENPDE